jgi:hypothetical protein
MVAGRTEEGGDGNAGSETNSRLDRDVRRVRCGVRLGPTAGYQEPRRQVARLCYPHEGSNVPLEIDVKPDGSYATLWGGKSGVGRIMMEGGKLMADGHLLYGTGTTTAGQGKAELTLTTKDGKQMMSGAGRDDDGPYNFQLTKQ